MPLLRMRQCIRQTHAQARRGSKLSPDLYEAVMTGDWKLARFLKNEKVCAGDLNWKRLRESILPPPPGKVNQHLREGGAAPTGRPPGAYSRLHQGVLGGKGSYKVQDCEWTIGNLEMTIDKLERQADPSAVVELVKEQIQGNWGTRLLHKLYFYFMYRILFLVDLGTDALVAASMWQAGGQQRSVWFWITVTFMALPYAILAASVTIYWKSFWNLANPVTWDLKLEEMRIEYKAPFYEVLAFYLRYFLQNLLDWLFKTWHNSSLEVFEAFFYDHLLHPDRTLQGPFWASYEQLKKVVEGFLESLPQAIVQIDADGMWFPLRGLAPSMVMRELEFRTVQDHAEFYVKPKGDVKRDA
ncbi:hypothetical protein CYMTET_9756 [Cymbomonas tetramitiformis]|uniref:Uncharacterized protein n=1 Tax=Cymbomonas tetramitiformis TaxID=36881 RepID=A0AAE0GR11_9CHLO|nr:hypothetical protein CYMTET_9756 [Cymbomonas tetramitiformis]